MRRHHTLPRIFDALLDRYRGIVVWSDLAAGLQSHPDLVREILTTTALLAALDAEQALRRPLLREHLRSAFEMSFTPDSPHDLSDADLEALADTAADYAATEAALEAGYARLGAAERALRFPDTDAPEHAGDAGDGSPRYAGTVGEGRP